MSQIRIIIVVEYEVKNVSIKIILLGTQPNDGIIMTKPGNLQCKNIIHVVGQTDAVKIQSTVKNVLHLCIKHSHSSVSLPAIGTGELVHYLHVNLLCLSSILFHDYLIC